jgi:putative endonuclease
MRCFYVYILANRTRRLYVGVTNSILRRVGEHKNGTAPAFTRRYNINRLVYFEANSSIVAAIHREKQLKRWSRKRKTRLIEGINPDWLDLSEGWYESSRPG